MVPQVRVRVLDLTWVGQFPENSRRDIRNRSLHRTNSPALCIVPTPEGAPSKLRLGGGVHRREIARHSGSRDNAGCSSVTDRLLLDANLGRTVPRIPKTGDGNRRLHRTNSPALRIVPTPEGAPSKLRLGGGVDRREIARHSGDRDDA